MRLIRRPGAILALLTALNLLNYIDRYVLPAVLPKVEDELHLSNFVGGSLATMFLLGYFLTSPFFGQWADRAGLASADGRPRAGRKGLMAAGVAIWSAATFATGIARGAPDLVGTRIVVGVGEASYATIAPTLIDDMAPAEKKGRWLAIFYLAIPVGSALGFILGGLVQKAHGWRAAFFLVGGPGILAALLCLLIAEPVRRTSPEAVRLVASAKTLWNVPLYRVGVLGYSAQTFAVGGFGYWAPTFLLRHFGLPLEKGASTFGAILVVAGGVGTLLGGLLCDRMTVRACAAGDDDAAARIALRMCAVTSLVAAPLAAAAFLAPSPQVFFVCSFLCELALFASTSPVNGALLRTAPLALRASAMALSIFCIHMFGDLWSPPLLGFLQDRFPSSVAMMLIPVAIAVSAALWTPPKGRAPA
jgi:MFS family permease